MSLLVTLKDRVAWSELNKPIWLIPFYMTCHVIFRIGIYLCTYIFKLVFKVKQIL